MKKGGMTVENNDYEIKNNILSDETEEKPSKEKDKTKRVPIAVVAVCLALCIAFSGAIGYIGGVIAGNLNSLENEEGGTSGPSSEPSSEVTSLYTDSTGNEASGLSIADVAEKTADSVVVIITETLTNDAWYGNYVESGAGSGVIIEESGYIVTCHHVIEDATTVNVTLNNGEQYVAEVVGSDEKTDIALLKIEASGLTVAVLGNSDEIRVGETAIVIGNPLGTLGGSVTNGIISARERKVTIDNRKMTLIQTNADINPGNSGGALFDDAGILMGIVNAKNVNTSVEGIGFAIPVNVVKTIISDLYNYGYVKGRASLGLSLVEISDSVTALRYGVRYLGVYILNDNGNFKAGDLIISIDGNENVSTLSELSGLLDEFTIGDEVEIKVYRNKKYETIKLKLVEDKNISAFE